MSIPPSARGMRRVAVAAVIGLVAAACTSGGEGSTTTTATTLPTTTPPSPDPELTADDFCDQLKIAAFEIQAGVRSAMEPILAEEADLSELEEQALADDLGAAVVAFYQRLGELAAEAPPEIAEDLETVAGIGGSLEEAMAEVDPDAELELADVVPEEVTEAAERVTAWTEDNCGTPIVVEPKELIESTMMILVLQAFGQMFTELGEGLAEGLGEAFEEGITEGEGSSDGMVYGSSAELDALWDACAGGDGAACDELYSVSPIGSEYEAFAQTCGGVVPLREGFGLDCASKLSEVGPQLPGDDAGLDQLVGDCEAGDLESCDQLFLVAPIASGYEAIALTCGGARPEGGTAPCAFTSAGEPYTYGDDADLDASWDACVVGDAGACSDLYFASPFESVYEALGQVCDELLAVDAGCDRLEGFLLGPST